MKKEETLNDVVLFDDELSEEIIVGFRSVQGLIFKIRSYTRGEVDNAHKFAEKLAGLVELKLSRIDLLGALGTLLDSMREHSREERKSGKKEKE